MKPLVSVMTVNPEPRTIVVQAMGTVVPAKELILKSRVAGEIVDLNEEFIEGGLLKKDEQILQIEDVDIVDGTPLLDIKPYVPEFDAREANRIGWLAKKVEKVAATEADERF